jgi:diguanylate cyclase (GGDEF)-like protein
VIAGTLALGSAGLFSNLGQSDLQVGARTLVINRAGVIVAHPDPARLLGKASEEPGLDDAYMQWRDSGSPIDPRGRASLSSGYLISMAGIAASDWVLVHMTPQSIALHPLRAAQHAAWLSAAGVGLAAALLATWFGLRVTRPMDKLRDRAMASLTDARSNLAPWPRHWRGEVGELARVFQHVEDERERHQAQTQGLLRQLEAVLGHVDLDKFKYVNDTGGHAAGDTVLRDIARKLASQVRKADTVARLGGDEFAVLLDQCPVVHAREIAEKMRQAVMDYRLDWQGQPFSVGASIGLVRVDAAFTSAKDVLAAADNACYAAKHRGRNCVVVYGD